jgi:antitoxin component HigA of HigAB toxin-antitoxin module
MDTIPLRTEADYERTLSEIEPYFNNPPPLDTPALDGEPCQHTHDATHDRWSDDAMLDEVERRIF